jgi:hypothetical protein
MRAVFRAKTGEFPQKQQSRPAGRHYVLLDTFHRSVMLRK